MVLEADTQKQKKTKIDTSLQPKMSNFITYFPTFQKAYINWLVQTYQPISSCENLAFRTLCQSLNVKAPILGREKVRCLLTKEVLEVRAAVTTALKGMYFSATTDAWTANNNVNYSTCTVHFIDTVSLLEYSRKQAPQKQKMSWLIVKVFGKRLIFTTGFVQPLLQIQRLPCVKQGVFLSVLLRKLVDQHNGMDVWITFSSSSQKLQ
jgi:hypothetical protein